MIEIFEGAFLNEDGYYKFSMDVSYKKDRKEMCFDVLLALLEGLIK